MTLTSMKDLKNLMIIPSLGYLNLLISMNLIQMISGRT